MAKDDQPKNYRIIQIPDKYFEGLDPDNDMGDLFRGYRRYWQAKRTEKIDEFDKHGEEFLMQLPFIDQYRSCTEWHKRFFVPGIGWCDYYPSRDRLVIANRKTVRGDFISILNYLRKHHRRDTIEHDPKPITKGVIVVTDVDDDDDDDRPPWE